MSKSKLILLLFSIITIGSITFSSARQLSQQPIESRPQASQPTTVPSEEFLEFPSPHGTICKCPANSQFVCGTDYATYTSACEANCYDISVAYLGDCRIADGSQTILSHCPTYSTSCPEGEIRYLGQDGCPTDQCYPGLGHTHLENEELY